MPNTNLTKTQTFEMQWIPISEALPEIGSTVLICYDQDPEPDCIADTQIDILLFLGDNLTHRDWNDDEEYHVVAWMPLPPLYKQ